ncbi:MAG: helix-turn-helix domain-containing protein [Thermomicrobiales bacterium]
MRIIDEEYLTVAEAAALLRVAPSTIRRWIREGDLPAYRLGRRRVALRRGDLKTLVSPVQLGTAMSSELADDERAAIRRLTPEEKRRALEAMERATQLRKRTLADRGGKPFPPAWKELAELRDERTRQLS